MTKIIPIGTKVFMVHHKYVDEKINGGIVKVCKIKTYQNFIGNIEPICTEIGNSRNILIPKKDFTPGTHYLYPKLEQAIKAITTKKVKSCPKMKKN